MNPDYEYYERIFDHIASICRKNNITFVTATQPPRHNSYIMPERPLENTPDAIIIDYIGSFK